MFPKYFHKASEPQLLSYKQLDSVGAQSARQPIGPVYSNGTFDQNAVAATFSAVAELARGAGNARVEKAFVDLANNYATWKSGVGRQASDAKVGEYVADQLRALVRNHTLWGVSGKNQSHELRELTKELKHYFRTHSAPGVIDNFSAQWAEQLNRRVQGFSTVQPGAETAQTIGVGTTAGAGVGPTAVLAAKIGFRGKTTTNVDDDGDFNLIRERRGDMSFLAKSTGPAIWNAAGELGGNYSRGKFFESDNLKDLITIGIMDKINDQTLSRHVASGGLRRGVREKVGSAEHKLARILKIDSNFLNDSKAPMHLTAEKLAKGAMNQGRIQKLAEQIAHSATGADRAAGDLKLMYPSFIDKIANRPNFLTEPDIVYETGVLNRLPISVPAATVGANPLKQRWTFSTVGGVATAKAGVGNNMVGCEASLAGEVAHKSLHLERLKKTHELLALSYAGSKDEVTSILDALSRPKLSNEFTDELLALIDGKPLIKPGERFGRSRTRENQPHVSGLSKEATQAYAARLAGTTSPKAFDKELSAIELALNQLSRKYHEFHGLLNNAISVWPDKGGEERDSALAKIDKLLFNGEYLSKMYHSYGDGREFLGRADDRFCVALAAIGHRFSLLKEAIVSIDETRLNEPAEHNALDKLRSHCKEVSKGFATASAGLKKAPTILEPDHLLRFTSVTARDDVIKNIVGAQANAKFQVNPLGAIPDILMPTDPKILDADGGVAQQKMKVKDIVPLNLFSGSIKFAISKTSADHPNPFRAGHFTDVTLELSAAALAKVTDFEALHLWLKGQFKELSHEESRRMSQDILASKQERLSRLVGGSAIQFSWRWRKLDDKLSGIATSSQLQRFRLTDVSDSKLSAKVPVGTVILATTGQPVELTPEFKHETSKTQPHKEKIGRDIGYQLIRYSKPKYFDPKRGFTDLNALKAHLDNKVNDGDLIRLTDYLGYPKTVIRTVRQFFRSIGDIPAEPSKSRTTDLEVFNHSKYREIVNEAVHAKAFDASSTELPSHGGVLKSPYEIPRLISLEAFEKAVRADGLESKLKNISSPKERLNVYLDNAEHRKVFEQFLSILHHYNEIGDILKTTRSFRLRVRDGIV
jgi:hypothetical protein